MAVICNSFSGLVFYTGIDPDDDTFSAVIIAHGPKHKRAMMDVVHFKAGNMQAQV